MLRADDAFGDVDATMIREAEDRAREQSGSSADRETTLRSAVPATTFEATPPEPACDEEARSSSERWLACID
ncbi:MAG: hypothetical protein R3315_01455, partial [Woeseiaceae bacterium]|nr:hypothetical protein [Woeseiaceae bacterium]